MGAILWAGGRTRIISQCNRICSRLYTMYRPHLTLEQLIALVVLAETGSLTAAAERLHLTQPTLSYRVQEAERRLGVSLFQRSARQLRPTPAGQRLLHSARAVLVELEAAEQEVLHLGRGVEAVVRIGSRGQSSFRWLPGFLRHFEDQHPSIAVEVVPIFSTSPFQALLEGSVDVEIATGEARHRGVERLDLFTDELVALLPERHPLSAQDFISAADLAGETYITTNTIPDPGHESEQVFRPARVTPRRVVSVGLTEAVIEMVRAGFGVAMLSRWAIEEYRDTSGLAILRVNPDGVRLRWYAALRRGEMLAATQLALALQRWVVAGMAKRF